MVETEMIETEMIETDSTSISVGLSARVDVNYANDTKADARETFLSVYRGLHGDTGRYGLIPCSKQYVTLCANQSPSEPLCEIEQMLREGLRADQYVGVDMDADVIEKNRIAYPKMKFIHGDWLTSILGLEDFNPAIIHFDTKNEASNEAMIAALASTMEVCPVRTFVAANFVTQNPYSGEVIDIGTVAERLAVLMGVRLNDWESLGSFSYVGDGCKSEMSYLMLWRVS